MQVEPELDAQDLAQVFCSWLVGSGFRWFRPSIVFGKVGSRDACANIVPGKRASEGQCPHKCDQKSAPE
jgi:hypothetical protein